MSPLFFRCSRTWTLQFLIPQSDTTKVKNYERALTLLPGWTTNEHWVLRLQIIYISLSLSTGDDYLCRGGNNNSIHISLALLLADPQIKALLPCHSASDLSMLWYWNSFEFIQNQSSFALLLSLSPCPTCGQVLCIMCITFHLIPSNQPARPDNVTKQHWTTLLEANRKPRRNYGN